MRAWSVLVALVLWTNSVFAGELRLIGDKADVEGVELCNYRFEGTIAKGDAVKFAAIPGSVSGKTVCFDSPGGSFTEGLALFDIFWEKNLRATVLPGDRCESACALAFLGGSAQLGTGLIQFRMREIHLGGKLGFHSPGFPVRSGRTYSAGDVETGFKIAVEAARAVYDVRLTEMHGVRGMTEYLYDRILRTPATSMFYIDRVGRAIMADVQVYGVAYPNGLTKRHILSVCDLAYLRNQPVGRDGISVERMVEEVQSSANALMQSNVSVLDRVREFTRGSSAFTLVRGYPASRWQSELICKVTRPLGAKIEGYVDVYDYRTFASTRGFEVSFHEVMRIGQSDYARFDTSRLGDPVFQTFVPYFAIYGAETRLEDLPRQLGVESAKEETLPRLNFEQTEGLPEAKFTRLDGIDLVGGDLTEKGHRPSSLGACERICRETPGCGAYTWVRDKLWCFPKSAGQGRKINPGMVSGVRRN